MNFCRIWTGVSAFTGLQMCSETQSEEIVHFVNLNIELIQSQDRNLKRFAGIDCE